MISNNIKVAFFLVLRYIRGASVWTTGLILFVMVLTFLNLTVIGGVLEGIVVGSLDGLRDKALGDLYISSKDGTEYIERSQHIIGALENNSNVKSISPRYRAPISIIAEEDFYSITNNKENRKEISTLALGVYPEREKETTGIDKSLIEGSYFSSLGHREILIGSGLLSKHSPFGDDVLQGVGAGKFVYVRFGGTEEYLKYLVRGVYRTKAGELDIATMLHANEVRLYNLIPGNNVNSIAVRTNEVGLETEVKDFLLGRGFDTYAKIETIDEAVGRFLNDVRTVFKLIGNIVGAIGLTVSSITIFIIIFVTASSKSKYIGILKAIGITPRSIKFSYILYALFFAISGISIGLLILLFILVPYFNANPIQFPFSDGILYFTSTSLMVQISLLLIATFIAGYIPSNKVVRRHVIDAVRGR